MHRRGRVRGVRRARTIPRRARGVRPNRSTCLRQRLAPIARPRFPSPRPPSARAGRIGETPKPTFLSVNTSGRTRLIASTREASAAEYFSQSRGFACDCKKMFSPPTLARRGVVALARRRASVTDVVHHMTKCSFTRLLPRRVAGLGSALALRIFPRIFPRPARRSFSSPRVASPSSPPSFPPGGRLFRVAPNAPLARIGPRSFLRRVTLAPRPSPARRSRGERRPR